MTEDIFKIDFELASRIAIVMEVHSFLYFLKKSICPFHVKSHLNISNFSKILELFPESIIFKPLCNIVLSSMRFFF